MEAKRFYRYELFKSFAQGLVDPFIPVFALTLGATNFLIGSLSSLTTLTNLLSQLFFSVSIIKARRKKFILFLATVFWSLTWLIVGKSKNPYELIISLSFQAIFSALITLSWTDLFVSSVPSYRRGRIIGKLNYFNRAGSLISTLISGYVLMKYGFTSFVFALSATFGLLASVNFFTLRGIARIPRFVRLKFERIDFGKVKKNEDFYRFLKAKMFLAFATGIAGPFFTVQLVKGFHGTTLDIALIALIGSLARLAVYKPWGYLVDFIGRKSVMMACILFISLYPFVYAFSPNILFIYLFTIIGDISWAGFDVASFTYFSESIQGKDVFELTALYNFSTQMFNVIGKFIGGIVAEGINIKVVFVISFLLRLASLMFFRSLRERTGKAEEIIVGRSESFSFTYTIENTIAIYSKLFSLLRKEVRERRRSILGRIDRIIKFLSKLIEKR